MISTQLLCVFIMTLCHLTHFVQSEEIHLDDAHLHDKDHLKEHLDEVADKKLDDMSNEEMEFTYFKMHDQDKNNKLDGLELAKSLMDHHGKSSVSEAIPEQELEQTVSRILQDEDANKDGYIDYPEFIAATRKYNSAAESTESHQEEKPKA